MSAIRPNLNWDNETATHTPFSESSSSKMLSLYEQFMRPKSSKFISKQKKKLPDTDIKTVGFDNWFKE